MPPRARRLVASIAVLVFLTFWVWGAVTLSTRLPDNFLVELLFYALAGTCWGLPLIPLLKWAERG
jgi:hypothetical protein